MPTVTILVTLVLFGWLSSGQIQGLYITDAVERVDVSVGENCTLGSFVSYTRKQATGNKAVPLPPCRLQGGEAILTDLGTRWG